MPIIEHRKPDKESRALPDAVEVRDAHEEAALQQSFRHVTNEVLGKMGVSGRAYLIALVATGGMALLGLAAWGYQLWFGIGVSGLQHPMMWAVYITNFVWWIGIAHAGTLISAVLYLLRAYFRPAVSRSAEAIAIFAVTSAALFPVIHLGRAWRSYWLFPYPNQRELWVTFRSPLILDVFALFVDLIVAVLFLWAGLIPDAAVVRDRSRGWRKTVYGLLSLGWEGTGRQWKQYLKTYFIIAALAACLAVSGHAIVSWDFSLAVVPEWHSTIFPIYFLSGAVLSGLAMVLLLIIPMRAMLGLKDIITMQHLDWLARIILMNSLLVTFSFAIEYFMLWYSSDVVAQLNFRNKYAGAFVIPFWTMLACCSIVPLVFFWPHVRRSIPALLIVSVLANVGIWLERFLTIAGGLARGYVPYAWADTFYHISMVEIAIFLGSMGWFLFCFLLFMRYVPVVPISEIKRGLLRKQREQEAIDAPEGR